ncbi:helix-turn-helix domain-containing protein [Streptosporangium sp. NPDC004631]
MEEALEKAVRRVIETMREHLGDELTIDDMARTAMFSKFHFSRVFRQVTGISPGRFLSALRLQEAKRLLLSTSLSVADISIQVGYSSVGTFSSRFKSCVGLAPTTYRRHGGFAPLISTGDRPGGKETRPASVQGRVWAPSAEQCGLIFVGLFPTCIPQGPPVRCAVLRRPGPYVLDDVPQGAWHLLAHSVAPGNEKSIGNLGRDQSVYVGGYGPITVKRDIVVKPADVQLRPIDTLDPPVLLALLDVRLVALNSVAS